MIIITNANGDSITSVSENIYQGSNRANTIYWLIPLPSSNIATVSFVLPNGEQTSEQLGTAQLNNLPSGYENFSMWKFDILDDITKYYGTIRFQLWLRNSQGQIVASVGGSFNINKGVTPVLPDEPSADVYEQILEAIASIQEDLLNGWVESKALLPYDENFTYSRNAVCISNDNKFYKSKIANNKGNPLTDTDSWLYLDFATGGDISDLEEQVIFNSLSIARINQKIPSNASSSNKMATASDIINLQNNKQNNLTQAQLNAVNSGITSEKVAQIETNKNDIATINSKIPAQASSSNQLADKDFVNSSIATNTANFVGTVKNVTILNTNKALLTPNSGLYSQSYITAGSVINGTTYTEDTIVQLPITITQQSILNYGSYIYRNSIIQTNSVVNHKLYTEETTLTESIEVREITNNDYANVINQELDFATTTEMNNYNKTLLTNFDYGWVVNGAKYDLYRFDIETQTWGLRATNINKGDVTLITAYNRYTYNASLDIWKWNYTVNTSGFTASQWAAINSGATAEQIAKIGTSALNTTAQNLSDAINELLASGGSQSYTAGTNISIDNDVISAGGTHETTKQTFEIAFNSSNKLVIEVEDTGRTILRHYENNNSYMLVLPKWAGIVACINQIFPTFSQSVPYAVGDLVNYNESFYRCTTAITTPHDWDSTEWTSTTLEQELKSKATTTYVDNAIASAITTTLSTPV